MITDLQSEVMLPELSVAIRTLVGGGFIVDDAQRKPGYILIFAHRCDEFGAEHSYCFAIAEDYLNNVQVDAARIAADYRNAQLIVVGSSDAEIPVVHWSRFINLFGGPIFSISPLELDFREQLLILAHNQLPDGLQGKADDLFERYAQIALEFILGGRVVRYGQSRQFEARPDGIAMPSLNFSALYDAKAYSEGYKITSTSMRQFKSYVDDFSRRYQSYLPRLNVFIVISSKFLHRPNTLEKRSRELLSQCQVPLAYLTASSLAEILEVTANHPQFRRSINWSRVFADPIVHPEEVKREIEAISRDHIIPEF